MEPAKRTPSRSRSPKKSTPAKSKGAQTRKRKMPEITPEEDTQDIEVPKKATTKKTKR